MGPKSSSAVGSNIAWYITWGRLILLSLSKKHLVGGLDMATYTHDGQNKRYRANHSDVLLGVPSPRVNFLTELPGGSISGASRNIISKSKESGAPVYTFERDLPLVLGYQPRLVPHLPSSLGNRQTYCQTRVVWTCALLSDLVN